MAQDPKTPGDKTLRRDPVQNTPVPVSSAPKTSGKRWPPTYLPDIQRTPSPVSSPPGTPLGSILGKRTAEGHNEGSRRSPYEADLSSHPVTGLPPKYANQVHIDQHGNWAPSGDGGKIPDAMPPPVPNIYYPIPNRYQTPGGPANTIGAPFRLDATDNVFAPPPSGIHEYSDEAIAKIRDRITADPELRKNMSGFDPAFMVNEGLLEQPPDSVAAMALAAGKWASMPNTHPKKVLKRKLDFNKFIPEPRGKTPMYKDWMKLMMGLDGQKQVVQQGEDLSGRADDSERTLEERQTREKEREEVIQHLTKAKDSYNNFMATLYPDAPVTSSPKFKGDPKELIDKVQLHREISYEMSRLHDIRREIKAIVHQHDIVWKDKLADDPIVRKNKFMIRFQLRDQHKDAESRYLKQKQIAYDWMEEKLGSSAWLKKRKNQSKGKVPQDPTTEPVVMSKWRTNPKSGQVEGAALRASQDYSTGEDSEMSEAYDFEKTSTVTWRVLTKLYKVLVKAGVTTGVCAANGDGPALAPLNYDPEQYREPKRFVTLARAYEDLFEIMDVISAKVRREEIIARRDLDRPMGPGFVQGNLLDRSEETGDDSYSSTSAGNSEFGDRDTPDDMADAKSITEILSSSPSPQRPDTPRSVHFTPPKVPQNTPIKPYSAWRPIRDATPRRTALKPRTHVGKSLSAVAVTPSRSRSHTPVSAPRLRKHEQSEIERIRSFGPYSGLPRTAPPRTRPSTVRAIYSPVSKLQLNQGIKREPGQLEGVDESDGSVELGDPDEGQYDAHDLNRYRVSVGSEGEGGYRRSNDNERGDGSEGSGSEDTEYTDDSDEVLEEEDDDGDSEDRLED